MNLLLTFTGFHDPWFRGLVDEEEQPGPILSLLTQRRFDHIFLFDTPATAQITAATQAAIWQRHSYSRVHIREVNLTDPTSYSEILSGLRGHLAEISACNAHAQVFVAVASGTPQMHACWVMLIASGALPARILHIRPPRFVTRTRPLVSELDVTDPAFPRVHFGTEPDGELPDLCGIMPPPSRELAHPITAPKSMAPEPIGHAAETARQQLGIVGNHAAMRRALEMGDMLAPSQAPVLILGETGTGKELFARYIHHLSGRAQAPFVAVNCAAIPHDLVESLLFGHKKGAFTGAHANQKGKFDAADGGTLFLDELGELPISAQAKLLRVLQDGMVEPIGQARGHRVTVRIVAATNQDVTKLVREGRFRQDVYYRLNVGEIRLPPLRERRSDIPELALHILDRLNATLRHPKRLTSAALTYMAACNWPGNVRDLENSLERSALLSRKAVLDVGDLILTTPLAASADVQDTLPEPYEGFSLEEFLSRIRQQMLQRALNTAGGNQSQAARLLGISPQAVHKFLRSRVWVS